MACGAFSLFDVGHAFTEIQNITCLQLFKIPARPFDLDEIAQNFTTMVKVKVFFGKKDLFDDLFQNKSSLQEILREAQSELSPEDFQKFTIYREKILATIPLEKLRLPTREPTPSISLSGNSSSSRSKSKSTQETSEHSKRSGNDQNKNEEAVKDTAQLMKIPQQQVTTCPQKDPPSLIIKPPSVITELDKEWENFNELINLEGQIPKSPTSNTQNAEGVISTIVGKCLRKRKCSNHSIFRTCA